MNPGLAKMKRGSSVELTMSPREQELVAAVAAHRSVVAAAKAHGVKPYVIYAALSKARDLRWKAS